MITRNHQGYVILTATFYSILFVSTYTWYKSFVDNLNNITTEDKVGTNINFNKHADIDINFGIETVAFPETSDNATVTDQILNETDKFIADKDNATAVQVTHNDNSSAFAHEDSEQILNRDNFPLVILAGTQKGVSGTHYNF